MMIGSMTQKRPLLKLVHAGGIVETYDKPITAAAVMAKYPKHCVTRPDVFKYPWIVVRPQSVLKPGNVFYVVSYHTIRSLLQAKECPKLLTYPEEETARSEQYERTKHQERQKIDGPDALFARDEGEPCSYEESSSEDFLHSHQFLRRLRSVKHDENLRSGYPPGHPYGAMSSRRQLPRQYPGRERDSYSGLKPKEPYESSVELTRIRPVLKGLSLNSDSSSRCEANARKHFPDRLVKRRPTEDFTFRPFNRDPENVEESSPDLTPFQCLPKRRTSVDARKNIENYGRRNSALKHSLNVTDHSKELAPRKQHNEEFINSSSYSSDQLTRNSGNGYGLQREELVCSISDHDHCVSDGNSMKLKSCIKRSGLRLRDPRVKFYLPGEGKKLRVEVFEFEPSDNP